MEDGIGGSEGDVKVEQILHCDGSNEQDTEMVDKEVIVSQNASSELVSKNASENLGGNGNETEAFAENSKIPPVDNCEVTPQSVLTKRENEDVLPCPGDVGLETTEKDANGDPGQVEHINKKKRKGKVVSKVASSWSLRSRVQEKPKAPEPTEAVGEGSGSGESSRKRRRKKKHAKKINTNEFLRTRNQLSYLLGRIKYEQSLIDAYSAEGWKGLSMDKLKPEKELQRAKSHIVRYKLRIRELFQQLDSLLEVGKLPESLFDDQGEIDSEDIFCAKCGSKDLPLDNDIILCDGACERGFHQFCLEPPLLNEDIPPGDEDWFCPGCDCKDDCIDVLNDFQGTNISILDKWEKIFPEAAEAATGDKMGDGSSSDGEDDDHDPNKSDEIEKIERVKSSSDDSGYFSAPDELAAPNNEDYMGLPSEDSEDDDFDPDDADPDKQVKQSSSASDFTSDSEDLGALLDDATAPGNDTEHVSPPSEPNQQHTNREEEDLKLGRRKKPSLKNELSHLMESSSEPVSGRRHVERLDYKRLHDEEYGNISSDSSDEDFNDTKAPKKRKVNHQKTEAISPKKPQITENEVDTADEHNKESPQLPKRTRKSQASGGVSPTSDALGSSSGSSKRSRKSNLNDGVGATSDTSGGSKRSAKRRLGDAVSERLYESFSKNKYPERAVKEQLANELGLTIQQVSKWFGNARWSLNHRQQMESCIASKPSDPQPATSTENISSSKAVEMHGSDTNATEKHIAEKTVENAEN